MLFNTPDRKYNRLRALLMTDIIYLITQKLTLLLLTHRGSAELKNAVQRAFPVSLIITAQGKEKIPRFPCGRVPAYTDNRQNTRTFQNKWD